MLLLKFALYRIYVTLQVEVVAQEKAPKETTNKTRPSSSPVEEQDSMKKLL
jgi:hypothetical protein